MNALQRIVADAKAKRQPLDLHLHTRFSIDVTRGCSFEDYILTGDRLGIVPGFLDHFQAEKLGTHGYPFNDDALPAFLDAYDKAKRTGCQSFLGLEVDFYEPKLHGDWNSKTADWLDDHGEEFDYFVGTIHDVFTGTITIPFELRALLEKHDFPALEDAYFNALDAGIRSGRFQGFAHLDVIYRFCGEGGVVEGKDGYYAEARTTSAMKLCEANNTCIELNLRGLDHPWRSTYPAEPLFVAFKHDHPGAVFFPGSDSHDVKTFERFAPVTRKYCDVLFT